MGEKFSVSAWVRDLEKFLQDIKGRGGTAEIEMGTSDVLPDSKIPAELRELLAFTKGKLSFRYLNESQGSKRFGGISIDAAELPRIRESAEAWARDTWIAEEPEIQAQWMSAVPFTELANGDFLALERAADGAPVIYLSHDDESRIISPSLNEFLRNWAAVEYRGPEIWELEEFIEAETGYLTGAAEDTEE